MTIIVVMLSVYFFSSKHSNTKYNDKKNGDNKVVLQVATSTPFPPFEFIENGKVVGIDMDILDEISKETGIEFNVNEMAFSSIIAGLSSKKIDMAIAGMSVTEKRKEQVDFTTIYFKESFALVSKKEFSFRSLGQLADKTVVVQTGTTEHDCLLNYNKNHPFDKQIKIYSLDDNATAIEMVVRDKADALLAAEMPGETYVKMYDGVVYELIKSDSMGCAIALQKNSQYTKIIDDALQKLKQNGTIDKIINKWKERYVGDAVKKAKQKKYMNSLLFIFKGSLVTIQYVLSSIICGFIIALFFTLFTYSGSKILFLLTRAYVSIIRGTPLLLQMSFIYFILPQIIGIDLSIFPAAVMTLSINSAGYLIEIIRSGVQTIDKGQFDACKSLNLSKYQAIKDIYIPQVIHNIFPALINEFIALIKESSIISIFGGYEIMKRTNIVIAEYYSYFTPLMIAGLSYYIMTFTLEMFAHWWESKYKY